MPKYRVQVLCKINQTESEWRDMRPTGGAPYEWDTREKAEQTARMCYPGIENAGSTRIVEVLP